MLFGDLLSIIVNGRKFPPVSGLQASATYLVYCEPWRDDEVALWRKDRTHLRPGVILSLSQRKGTEQSGVREREEGGTDNYFAQLLDPNVTSTELRVLSGSMLSPV